MEFACIYISPHDSDLRFSLQAAVPPRRLCLRADIMVFSDVKKEPDERMLPETITSEQELDELLSRPHTGVVDMMRRIEGDIIILGIGGKMGHTIGRQAVRAIEQAGVAKRVVGVSRFSDDDARKKIENSGIETIKCDLLDPDAVAKLPDVPNVIFMAGRKFGTQGAEQLTWAMNTTVPSLTALKYRKSRIVAFSTGCVYPLVAVETGGSLETDPADPVGEYAMSCLGRERVFEYAAATYGTPITLIRLNYAIEMRYGVLHDIATSLLNDKTADVSIPAFNAIWQGDACSHILQTLEYCDAPPFILNVTGPETVSTRRAAERIAQLLGVEAEIPESETRTALLSNASRAFALFGYPTISMDTMMRWTAEWLMRGGSSFDKPTHFEVRHGNY